MTSLLRNRKGKKGFTLIELMIVVAIIGILAAIAIPNFLRFQLRAKSSEGKTNIAAIRTAQESYAAEFNGYVSSNVTIPATVPSTAKVTFTPTNGFVSLGWAPEGNVYFNYQVTATTAGNAYTVGAQANIDGVGANQIWGYKKPAGTTYAATANGCASSYTALADNTVGPCSAGSGSSVF